MDMDMKKKEGLEKRIMLGLVVVFLAVFLMGPAKQLNLLRFVHRSNVATRTPPAGEGTTAPRPIWASMQGGAVDKLVDLSISQAGAPAADTLPTALIYTAQELRDPLKSLLPTEPSVSAASSAPSVEAGLPPQSAPPALRLQGLLWGGPEPKAIINDEVYGIGDVVEGATIKSIDHRQVTMEFQGTELSLSTTKERQAGQAMLSRTLQR